MKRLATILSFALMVTGCATVDTVKKYWPRAHDPVMFSTLVDVELSISDIDCSNADWSRSEAIARKLATYTEWRKDPQAENLRGLHRHAERMSKGGSKTFCELGKKTAAQRIMAARSAWETR